MTEIIAITGTLIAMVSAIFAYFQAQAAKQSLRQAYLLKLFSTFDAASESTIANPELLYSVHGLEQSVSMEEARSIAYLSLLLDAFQHFYAEQYCGDFKQMADDMKKNSTFLNQILRVPGNRRRWERMKSIYYGDFDKSFIKAIDSLLASYEGQEKET